MSGKASPEVLGHSPPGGHSARKSHALELFRGLPARYDFLSAALSFGQDPRWRRALVRAVSPGPSDAVLDVATGTGLVAAELLAAGSGHVVAIDQSAEMLGAARRRFALASTSDGARASGGSVRLVQAQAESLPFPADSFDALTFTYLLRYVDDPPATMRELARVLRPGGRIASVEFGVPGWAPARWTWRLYTYYALPALARAASREWAAVGRFLGPSIAGFYEEHPLPRIVEYWRAAGLEDVVVRPMSFGGGVLMVARKARQAAAPGGTGAPA
jgi:demethylmenaquinone methyltransferase / 2-methoxy-6-polyprenyl-1,4-benzoquinol methylase